MTERRRQRLKPLVQGAPEREVAEELAFHFEQRVREYVAKGMDEAEARAAARARLGDLGGVQRECTSLLAAERRSLRRRDVLSDVLQDARFGARSAARAPLFTALAIAILAVGIGANTAVFSVLKAVLVDPLPYAGAGELMFVHGRNEDGTQERNPLSAANLRDLEARQRSFAALAAFAHPEEVAYVGADAALALLATRADPGLLDVLGVQPAMGRGLRAEDVVAEPVVLLSHGIWQRLFGGAADALGGTVVINGEPRTVVGVLPRGFTGPMGAADFWVPLDVGPWLANPNSARRSHWLRAVGRRAPGVSPAQAQSELAAIGAALAREHPESNAGTTLGATPLREALAGDTRTPLIVVMASAALVLLVACANLAATLLSRMIGRRGEFAVRLALGAGRGRIARQILTESTLLGLLGGAAGLLLAQGALLAFGSLAGDVMPPYAELRLDVGVLLFALAAALLTGLGFGLVPALSAVRAASATVLREEGRGASESRRSGRARSVLVSAQITFSVSLVVGAALLVRSFWAMSSAPLGFDAGGVLAVSLQLPERSYPTSESLGQFFDAFEERLRALPGVEAVGSGSFLPHAPLSNAGLTVEGVSWPSTAGQPFVQISSVSDGYFETLRIPLRAGRTFDGRDHPDAPDAVVISEAMARRYWPDGDPIGARIRLGPNLEAPWAHVVGVVGDVRTDPTRVVQEPMAYVAARQGPWPFRSVLIRTGGDPAALAEPVRQQLAALDPALPLSDATPLADAVAGSLAGRQLPVLLVGAFGAIALLLASIGVYALFASMAAAREREFGLRIALGASRGTIATLVLRQGALALAIGLLGGAAGALVVARALRHLLFGIGPFDAVALAASAAAVTLCAGLALLAPVRRATRTQPMQILR